MQLISALTSIYTKMGDNNKNEKNHVSEELAELIERKLAENIALLKLIEKKRTEDFTVDKENKKTAIRK